MPQYILREFKVTDTIDNGSRTVRQFQFTDWPEQGVPKSAEGFIDFIGQVHKTKEQFGQEGPITVHCRWVRREWMVYMYHRRWSLYLAGGDDSILNDDFYALAAAAWAERACSCPSA